MSSHSLRERLLALALGAVASAAAGQPSASELGRIDFPTSGSAPAQQAFLRGVLLLHSFEYEDAAEEFRNAQKIEPSFAMAYWGEAMTANHPIWMDRDRDAARSTLERLAPTAAERLGKAPTAREKAYLDAVEILYADGEKAERDRAYADAMGRLKERFPEDLEAASFYALALLGTCEGRRDVSTYMKAAAVAEEVFAKNPEHPGAAHYLIHSYDDPVHAPLGMRAARVYAKIAPAATHALHMPSHIFLASGMWDEVVSSNEASWKASVDRAERKSLGPDAHSFHALSWLSYGYLQQGRYEDARRTVALMEADASGAGSARARSALVAMRAAYRVETGRWPGEAPGAAAADGSSVPALDLFVRGLDAVESGDRQAADRALSKLAAGAPADDSYHSHGGDSKPDVSPRPTTDEVLRKLLEAKVQFAAGHRDRAIALAREAAANEDAMTYEFGPPDVVKPSHEMLGEMLLAAGRPGEARVEFDASLARAPGRARSLLGLARSAAAEGRREESEEAFAKLREVWKRADAGVAGLAEVRKSGSAGS
jgi:hypothetical protein